MAQRVDYSVSPPLPAIYSPTRSPRQFGVPMGRPTAVVPLPGEVVVKPVKPKPTLTHYILVFLATAIIVWFLFLLFKPNFVQTKEPLTGQPTGVLDASKQLGYSLLAGLIVVILMWIIRSMGK